MIRKKYFFFFPFPKGSVKTLPTIGITELLIILAVALLIFGPKSIPKIAKAIGNGLKEFKKASKGISDESSEEEDESSKEKSNKE